MRAGQFNRRITLQRRTPGTGPIGQPINTWEVVATVWASVRHASGLETIKADALTSVVKASIRIRFREDVSAGMRVALAGVFYDIRAVLPDLVGRQYVDLVCEVAS